MKTHAGRALVALLLLGKNEAVEDATPGRVERETHFIRRDGVRNVKPIRTQADVAGIGLNLQTPALVIFGPGKRNEVA